MANYRFSLSLDHLTDRHLQWFLLRSLQTQKRAITQKCGLKLGLAGIQSLVVQFLRDLLKTWHFQWQGLYRIMVPLLIIICTMEEQILDGRLLVSSLPLAMIMMPQLTNMVCIHMKIT
ncbi:hypothetical protein HYC85_001403 [Camellia sinensis]|uniref:Uncharacterized protein n=1 Tax=Camellia sinensis TaxID=4442 RepID=A0A7J7I742_CAMSI|nr:hypothetical protein HYC85_001403 [Camellia sinensis]